jgi:hypothetical protein
VNYVDYALIVLCVVLFLLNARIKRVDPEYVQAEFKLMRDCIVAYRSDFKALREESLQQHTILNNRVTGVALDVATRCDGFQRGLNETHGLRTATLEQVKALRTEHETRIRELYERCNSLQAQINVAHRAAEHARGVR